MGLEIITFTNRFGKPIRIWIEPAAEDFELQVNETAYFHIHDLNDRYQDPLDIEIKENEQLIVYEQRQKRLELFIAKQMVYSSDY